MSDGRYSLYIIRCADGSLYTGIALDVTRRLVEHRSGARGARYLRGRQPLQIVFQQCIGDRSLASRVEHRVKALDKTRKEALVAGRIAFETLLPAEAEGSAYASGVAGG